MPFNSGTVEAVSIKQLPEPDKYGNTYKHSLKVGEDWYVAGRGKNDKFNVKTKTGWHSLQKGDAIEYRYEEQDWGNGPVLTVKKSDITIVGEAEPAQQTAPNKSSEVRKTYTGNNDAGIKIGHAVNVAVQLLGKDKTIDALEDMSWQVLEMTHKMNQLYPEKMKEMTATSSGGSESNSAGPSKTSAKTAAGTKSGSSAKQKSVAATEDDFDDDLPFN